MATVLIVEDDKNMQKLTRARLAPYYTTLTADDGYNALDIIYSKNVDIIICDIMMPRMDGYELLKRIRQEGIDKPVLLLTAKSTFDDKREGYSLGTDEYLTKPVNYEELLWKISALLRRSKIATDKKIIIGKTSIDARTYKVKTDKSECELPKKEFELLYKLLSYPNQIFTHNQLLDSIWGIDSYSSEDTIKVHINRLRNKFAENTDFAIITCRGLGYKAEVKA